MSGNPLQRMYFWYVFVGLTDLPTLLVSYSSFPTSKVFSLLSRFLHGRRPVPDPYSPSHRQRYNNFYSNLYYLWKRYFATKLNTPITFANVVVSSVINTDTSRFMIPNPHKKTITIEAAIYIHMNPKMQ